MRGDAWHCIQYRTLIEAEFPPARGRLRVRKPHVRRCLGIQIRAYTGCGGVSVCAGMLYDEDRTLVLPGAVGEDCAVKDAVIGWHKWLCGSGHLRCGCSVD